MLCHIVIILMMHLLAGLTGLLLPGRGLPILPSMFTSRADKGVFFWTSTVHALLAIQGMFPSLEAGLSISALQYPTQVQQFQACQRDLLVASNLICMLTGALHALDGHQQCKVHAAELLCGRVQT